MNVTLASLAASGVVPPPSRHPLAAAMPAATDASQDLSSTAQPGSTMLIPHSDDSEQLAATAMPPPPPPPRGDAAVAAPISAPFCSLQDSVRIATPLFGRACSSASGECACVAPLLDESSYLWKLVTHQNFTHPSSSEEMTADGDAATPTVTLTVFAVRFFPALSFLSLPLPLLCSAFLCFNGLY
jgi:hypothetical protein